MLRDMWVPPQNPYTSAQELLSDLRTIETSLVSQGAKALADRRLRDLMRRAVEVFGFYLATVDLRQSSDMHEAVLSELLSAASIQQDYSSLSEEQKRQLLQSLLKDPRPLRVVGHQYSDFAISEIARVLKWLRECASYLAMKRSAITSLVMQKRLVTC